MIKKVLFISLLLFSISLFAQAPQKMSYQSVVRTPDGKLVKKHQVKVRISLLKGSEDGTLVYGEIHYKSTNDNGLVSLKIGEGTQQMGKISSIDWSAGPYFIKAETDPAGGNDYPIEVITELMSVPYALYAANSPAGAQGEMGPAGPAGPKGANGAAGPPGSTGATGPAGSQGVQGVPGAAGAQGIQGIPGIQGIAGPIGPQGMMGVTGAIGPEGPQGIPGVAGADGDQGIRGIAGPIGPQGMMGVTGAVGPEGIQGIAGPIGPQGMMGVTGAVGPEGPQGIPGVAGADGDQGIQGIAGPIGPQGMMGVTGAIGSQGIQGIAGPIGPQGMMGVTGAIGPQGNQGNPGVQGLQGDIGQSAYEVWIANGGVGTETDFITFLKGAPGATGPAGPQGMEGLLPASIQTGATPYWNGSAWMINSGNIYNNGSSVGVGTLVPAVSAKLEVNSTTQGFLLPRMTGAQRDAIVSPVAGLVVWCTNCGTKGEAQVHNGTEWTNMIGGTTAVVLLSIGDSYQGGKIGYLLKAGDPGYNASVQHGIIISEVDYGPLPWGCNTTLVGTSSAIGSGQANTTAIVNANCAAASTCARVCNDLILNGYSDWYLPSLNELLRLSENRAAIGSASFSDFYYCSTELDIVNNAARTVNVNYPSPNIAALKNLEYKFRPVRSF